MHQFLFLNTSLPSFQSSYSSQPPKWILSHFDKYHDSLAKLLQKNKKIHQIHYHQPITSETYLRKFDYHLKEPILPPKHIDVFSSLISFISLNIISLTVFMIILAYHYIENKQYILLLLFILLWKIPPIFYKMKEYLKKSISSVFEYYSGRIHFDEESKIEENESYIYMWNPHRMVPLGSFLSICSQEFQMKIKDKKKIHHVTHPFIHYYPFVSPLFDIFQFQTCSRENIESILDKKESIGIWLGGVKEMNIEPNAEEEQIYVSSRKGIFEIALKTGTSIIPSYTFGEINIYPNQIDSIYLPFFNLSLPFPSLSFLQKEINNLFQIFRTKPDYFTVIGKPIPVIKKDIITEDDINELKKIYIEELMHLYEKYKSVRYFYPKHLTIL